MEGVAIDGLDGVAVAQAGLGGRHTRLHLQNADGARNKLRNGARVAHIEILAL